MAEKLGFDIWSKRFPSLQHPDWPTHPPIRWVWLEALSLGAKELGLDMQLTTRLHLMSKLKIRVAVDLMSRLKIRIAVDPLRCFSYWHDT
jgi:hypothetical protein